MHKFAVLLTRNIPALKTTKNGSKTRTLYGLFYHQLTTHLVGDLKRVCPMHVMCEWMEMWWGPLRRLTLATSSKSAAHATLNALRRMCMRQRFGQECGARGSYAEPSHSDHGPISNAYLKHYGACDGERLELDERFLNAELEALLRQIPEYLELGEGVWYSVSSREGHDVLVFHVGAKDVDHVLPERQHFGNNSAAYGRAIEDAAFERMRRVPDNLFSRYCDASSPGPASRGVSAAWEEVLRRAQATTNPIEEDEDEDEDDGVGAGDDDELEDEAHELADDDDVDVDVAPSNPAPPLAILEPASLSGTWRIATNGCDGAGVAHLYVGGRRVGVFKGILRRGKPDGHGRLETASGDGWCGQMTPPT